MMDQKNAYNQSYREIRTYPRCIRAGIFLTVERTQPATKISYEHCQQNVYLYPQKVMNT